jgi:hypothetical protein
LINDREKKYKKTQANLRKRETRYTENSGNREIFELQKTHVYREAKKPEKHKEAISPRNLRNRGTREARAQQKPENPEKLGRPRNPRNLNQIDTPDNPRNTNNRDNQRNPKTRETRDTPGTEKLKMQRTR